MSTKKMPKNAEKYICEKCNFICIKKSNYEKHLLTAKHNLATFSNKKMPKNAAAEPVTCICGKTYKDRSGFWRHKKKCLFVNNQINEDELSCIEENNTSNKNISDIEYKDMIHKLIEQNKELQTMLIEQTNNYRKDMTQIIPKIGNTTNNNQFNINIFLNEQCKDAINMSEFIESIKLTIEDVSEISNNGQTKGMANLIVDKLNSLDVLKRPVHCSSISNETIYIKDENIWQKEEEDKPKLKHVLDELTKKTIKTLPELEKDPDKYVKTVSEVLKDPREDSKIISEIAKNISIEE